MSSSTAAPLEVQSYVFDPRPYYPLVVTAKRYWQPGSPDLNSDDALTLIFTHGTGFLKELWEPTMDDLLELVNNQKAGNNRLRVREMWAIDKQNHGEAAILNEETLKWGYEPIFGWEEYARVIHLFLGGFGTGVDVDFSKRRLVGIGHSMGAVCLLLSLGYQPRIKFETLIFAEFMSMAERFSARTSETLVKGAINRRDIWASREEAYKLLKSRPAWKAWDDRVLRKYVEEGMRPLPTADYPDKTEGVTLKCTRRQETACYRDPVGPSRAYNFIGAIARQIPTHLIYGSIDDYLPREVKEDIVNVAVGGEEHLASFSRVDGAGHLVMQTNPKGLAEKIFQALTLPPKEKKHIPARL